MAHSFPDSVQDHLSLPPPMSLADLEERVCDLACEQLGLRREQVKPNSRLTEDLHCDSLDLVEFILAIEEKFAVTIPDKAPNSIYKAVFTRRPFRLCDLAELVYLQQGTGTPQRTRWQTGSSRAGLWNPDTHKIVGRSNRPAHPLSEPRRAV